MYLVTYEEDGRLYQNTYSTLAEAERFAEDCALDGVGATLSQELRAFVPGAGLSLEKEYGLRPGREYPGSFGVAPGTLRISCNAHTAASRQIRTP